VIYAWGRMTNFLVGVWDDMVFQCNGPLGQPNTCVFCGRDGLNRENAYGLGVFLADGESLRDNFVDAQGTSFLEANTCRPSVILITAERQGSIDNLALELAWNGMQLSMRVSGLFMFRHVGGRQCEPSSGGTHSPWVGSSILLPRPFRPKDFAVA
jgi:hypothetical protein